MAETKAIKEPAGLRIMKFIVEINTTDKKDELHEPSIQDQIWWAIKDYINDKAQDPDKWDILVNIE